MPVATGDAFRYITTQGNNVGENDATLIAPDVNGTLTVVGGFGITLTADAVNRKITITNTGNGTGALSTITTQNSAGTYYPVFVTAPGTYNPATGTYTSSTLYYESTTTPLTYNPGTGTLTTNALVANASFTFNGITATSATGTGSSLVFSQSPTLSGTTTLNAALVGPSASANFTRFPNAQAVISNTASGIQQNESHNIGLMAEGTANNGNVNIYGVGIYGVGYTSATTRSGGVIGESHVSATTDVGSAIGVRGYSQDVHSGGINVGLYGNASGSTQNNYALYMAGGDIYSTVAQTWTMNGNLTFSGAYTITIPSLTVTNTITGSVSGNAGTVTNGFYTTSSFNLGTTSIAVNRASATQSLTGINIDGSAGSATKATNIVGGNSTTLLGSLPYQSATDTTTLLSPNTSSTKNFLTMTGTGVNGAVPSWGTLATADIPAHYIGTTSITFNRSSATQSLTGVNIDGSAGKATNLAGGNNTTLLGSVHYQSALDTTTQLSPNTTTTLKVLTQTGDGTNGAAPVWTTSTGTGNVVLATNPSLTAPTWGNTSNTTDADYTLDSSLYGYTSWIVSFTAARNLNVSNLATGRRAVIYIRNTNASSRVITINASTTTTGFTAVNLAVGAGAVSSTSVTLAATSGTAVVYVWNAGGNIVGMVN
jgi:hypothetical protein